MGRKSSDRWALPLGLRHHTALHAHGNEEEFLMGLGLDGRALATMLWAKRADFDAMQTVAFKFRQKGNAA
jgi:hypothetical protein